MRRVGAAGNTRAAEGQVTYAVATGGEKNFRAVSVTCASAEQGDTIMLPETAQRALMVSPGDCVICVRI